MEEIRFNGVNGITQLHYNKIDILIVLFWSADAWSEALPIASIFAQPKVREEMSIDIDFGGLGSLGPKFNIRSAFLQRIPTWKWPILGKKVMLYALNFA